MKLKQLNDIVIIKRFKYNNQNMFLSKQKLTLTLKKNGGIF